MRSVVGECALLFFVTIVLCCFVISRLKQKLCQSRWSFATQYLNTWKSAPLVSPHHTCPVTFWPLSAFEHFQSLHYHWHIRCLSWVWSGTTLHRSSVHLQNSSDATHSPQNLCDNLAAVVDFLNLFLMITVEKRRTATAREQQQRQQQQLKVLMVVKWNWN